MKINSRLLYKLYWTQHKSSHEIAMLFGVRHSTILSWMKRFKIPRRDIKGALRLTNLRAYVKVGNNLDMAYLAGVLKGDGHCYDYYFVLRVIDKDFAECVFHMLEKIGNPTFYVLNKKTTMGNLVYHTALHSKTFVERLNAISFSSLTEIEKIEFINGFADSEGCVELYKNCRLIRISNSDMQILKEISNFLTYLGIRNHVHKRGQDFFLLNISGIINIKRFYRYFRFSILRKQKRLSQIADYLPFS
jgi:intein-encoded DNA endonuclease-like protein